MRHILWSSFLYNYLSLFKTKDVFVNNLSKLLKFLNSRCNKTTRNLQVAFSDEKMGGRVSVINNTEVTIKVQFWQVSPLYSKTLRKGEKWVQETGAVHFTVKVTVQESDDYLFGKFVR